MYFGDSFGPSFGSIQLAAIRRPFADIDLNSGEVDTTTTITPSKRVLNISLLPPVTWHPKIFLNSFGNGFFYNNDPADCR